MMSFFCIDFRRQHEHKAAMISEKNITDHDGFVLLSSDHFQLISIVSSLISHLLCSRKIQLTAFIHIFLSVISSPSQANTTDLKKIDVQRFCTVTFGPHVAKKQ